MIKRLIFDIDGTLINGVNFDKAIEKTLMQLELFSEENKKKFIQAISTYENYHNGYENNKYLKHFSDILEYELDINFLKIFFDNLGKYAIPKNNEKLIKTIESLSKQYELVLLSNYFEKSQRGRLENIGINQYFSEYYGEKISKPEKQAYIDGIGVHKPYECVIIGDNLELDIIGAQKCGINTIWVNSKKIEQNIVKTMSVNDVTQINKDLINDLKII